MDININEKMDNYMIDDSKIDSGMSNNGAIDSDMNDNRMSDNKMSDNRMSDNRMNDNRMSDNRMNDNRMSDDSKIDNKLALEAERIRKMKYFETEALQNGYALIAGIDEVGRGPLAGPVVSAAVILEEAYFPAGINDSKILSEKKRERLYNIITSNCVSYGIGIVSEKIIDEINILNATKLSMKIAVESMKIPPDFLLIDAVSLDNVDIPQKSIVRGDKLCISIAAASILAKVCRDRIMTEYDKYYPEYSFAKHKGYGTKAHIEAIKKFNISPIHRITFVHV